MRQMPSSKLRLLQDILKEIQAWTPRVKGCGCSLAQAWRWDRKPAPVSQPAGGRLRKGRNVLETFRKQGSAPAAAAVPGPDGGKFGGRGRVRGSDGALPQGGAASLRRAHTPRRRAERTADRTLPESETLSRGPPLRTADTPGVRGLGDVWPDCPASRPGPAPQTAAGGTKTYPRRRAPPACHSPPQPAPPGPRAALHGSRPPARESVGLPAPLPALLRRRRRRSPAGGSELYSRRRPGSDAQAGKGLSCGCIAWESQLHQDQHAPRRTLQRGGGPRRRKRILNPEEGFQEDGRRLHELLGATSTYLRPTLCFSLSPDLRHPTHQENNLTTGTNGLKSIPAGSHIVQYGSHQHPHPCPVRLFKFE
ncbi:uncharacterized protein LOC141574607 [Camelus bactrianus]|uniref:Uncharacterized protein LOC141574607 n=1 Tax=Camelus bactrianus TaxID=9837 RepID=A0AC58P7V6_CAMBA